MVRKVLISSFFAGCFFVSNGFGEGAVFNAMSASRDMERRIYAGQYRVEVNTLRSESGLPPVSHVPTYTSSPHAPSPSSASGTLKPPTATTTRPVVEESPEKEETIGTLFWLWDPEEKTSTLYFARESDRKTFRVVYANSDSKDELKRLTEFVYASNGKGFGRYRPTRYEIKDNVLTIPPSEVEALPQKTSPSIEIPSPLPPGKQENSGTLFWLWEPKIRASTLYFVRESDRKVFRVAYANSDSEDELKRLSEFVYAYNRKGFLRYGPARYEVKDDVLTLPPPEAEALPQTGTSRSIDFSPTLTPADALRAQRQVRERENRAGYYPSWDNSGNWAPMKWEPHSARRN